MKISTAEGGDLFKRRLRAEAPLHYIFHCHKPEENEIQYRHKGNRSLPFTLTVRMDVALAEEQNNAANRRRHLQKMKDEIRERFNDQHIYAEFDPLDDHIQIRHVKNYGSRKSRQNDGYPQMEAWSGRATQQLAMLGLAESEKDILTPVLMVSPNDIQPGRGCWTGRVVLWAETGSAEAKAKLLAETREKLETGFHPNLKDTCVTSGGEFLAVQRKAAACKEIESMREEILRLTGATGRNFGKHAKEPFPDWLKRKMQAGWAARAAGRREAVPVENAGIERG